MDPFAPVQRALDAAPDTTCARCASPMSSAAARYDAAGQKICARCDAFSTSADLGAQIARDDPSRVANMWYGAVASVVMGLGVGCTLLLSEWFFVASFMGLVIGATVAYHLLRDPQYPQRMGSSRFVALALCAVGILLNLTVTLAGLALVLFASDGVGLGY